MATSKCNNLEEITRTQDSQEEEAEVEEEEAELSQVKDNSTEKAHLSTQSGTTIEQLYSSMPD
jgi:hypothetical protein